MGAITMPANMVNRSAILAVVFDCDDTLAPDTTTQLLKTRGFDKEHLEQFWKQDIAAMVKQEWDPSLAIMTRLAQMANQDGPLRGLSKTDIQQVGRDLSVYPGVSGMFPEIKAMIEGDEQFASFGVMVEYYIISGGIEELIRSHQIAAYMKDVWACSFEYEATGKIRCAKRVVTFTEKTRFLFNIQKGFIGSKYRSQPYAVNAKTPPEEVRVPFENMVYIGDGPSDIPCMSLLERNGGHVVGILRDENPYLTYASNYGRRAQITIPADYREGQIGRLHLNNVLKQAAKRIIRRIEFAQGQSPIPGY